MPLINHTIYDTLQLFSDQHNGCIVSQGFQHSINIFQRVNGVIHIGASPCGNHHPVQRNVWRTGRGQLVAHLY